MKEVIEKLIEQIVRLNVEVCCIAYGGSVEEAAFVSQINELEEMKKLLEELK